MNKRIGVDASGLMQPMTGVGYYLEGLLASLIEMREELSFFLYSPKESEALKKFSKFENVTLRISSRFAHSHSLWSQTTLAWLSYHDRLTFFWGPNLSVPLFKRKKQKNIFTIHDFTTLLYPKTVSWGLRNYLKITNRLMIQRADLLISNSHGTGKKLRQYYGRDSTVIEPPLKSSIRPYSQEELLPILAMHGLLYKEYALILGTLEPRKNVLPLLRCYAEAKATLLPLVMVGKRGWYGAKENQEITHLCQKGQNPILELGYLPEERATALLAGARYLIMPSLYEGYGMGIKEARTLNVPVICSDVEEMIEAAQGDAMILKKEGWQEQLLLALSLEKRELKVIKSSYPTNQELACRLSSLLQCFK